MDSKVNAGGGAQVGNGHIQIRGTLVRTGRERAAKTISIGCSRDKESTEDGTLEGDN